MPPKRKSEASSSSSTRKSSRRKTRKRPPKLVLKSTAKKSGNSKVTAVTLAMTAPISANSNTSGAKTVKKHVDKLNDHYGSQYNFIIGHLINEQLGCEPGDENFVPLTSKANSKHKTDIESPLANFLTIMDGPTGDAFNCALDDSNSLFLAVRYTVRSSSSFWGKESPDCFVPKEIEWEIELDIVNKSGTSANATDPSIKSTFKAFQKVANKHFKNKTSGTIKNEK